MTLNLHRRADPKRTGRIERYGRHARKRLSPSRFTAGSDVDRSTHGVLSIRHWTGVDPDTTAMRRALEDALPPL